MTNKSGNAYGLTTLCPINQDEGEDKFCSVIIRQRLQTLPLNEKSPWAKVPNTYLCRLYILNDVFYNPINSGNFLFYKDPMLEEHLKSKYLVFSSSFHGELEPYLTGMWQHAESSIRHVWEHCVAFEKVNHCDDFIAYIKRCQIKNTFFFNGSTDDSSDEQLKSLYLKQAFSNFAFAQQGSSAADLQAAFLDFINQVQPDNINEPTWVPGKSVI